MPSAVESDSASTIRGGHEESRPRISEPLQYSGLLDSYSHQDLTPVIGREYRGLQVADILKAENSDQIIKDLAVTSMFCAYPNVLRIRHILIIDSFEERRCFPS